MGRVQGVETAGFGVDGRPGARTEVMGTVPAPSESMRVKIICAVLARSAAASSRSSMVARREKDVESAAAASSRVAEAAEGLAGRRPPNQSSVVE